jgi:hypothetical protein
MSEFVITSERLHELEAAAAEAALLREKLNKRNNSNIARLNAYNAANPERAAERSKRSKQRNHNAYLARRRELYKQKIAAKRAAVESPGGSGIHSVDAPI